VTPFRDFTKRPQCTIFGFKSITTIFPCNSSAISQFRIGNFQTLGHQWYNINYREYDDGIQVGSFSSNAIRRAAPLLKIANSRLADPAAASRGVENVREARDASLKAGESLRFKYSRAGALKRLSIRIDPSAMGAALRDIQLGISFDGRETVRVPIGDFFATGPERLNDVQTYFFEVASDTGEMTAYWVMPFQHQVDVQLLNEGAETIDAWLECEIGDFQWSEHAMYFHANYRESIGVEVGREAVAQDWSYVELEGKGLYVGDSLSINNTAASWWGEGDEKIYVDGASFPTHFGTGSEDYYGYAWGRDFIFNQPFISQPQGDGNEPSFANPPGLTVNTRVRVLDAIPFNSSLKVDMELWHQKAGARVDLRVAVFWYGFPGTTARLP